MNKYTITYYTLSDGTNIVTVTAATEAEACRIVKEGGDCEMIVSVAEVG